MGKKITVYQASDWDYRKLVSYRKNGGEAFSVSCFGFDKLSFDERFNWVLCTFVGSGGIHQKLRYIFGHELDNFLLQLRLIMSARTGDIIYYSTDRHPYLIALCRLLRICRSRVLLVSHFSYSTRLSRGWLKKFLLRIEALLVFRGIDKIVFASEQLRDIACNEYSVPLRHQESAPWGADLDYFSRSTYSSYVPDQPYFFACGAANRDYDTLIEAFKNLPYHLVISCSKNLIKSHFPLPQNVVNFDFPSLGFDAHSHLRALYQGAVAVLVPIKEPNHVANGASVFVEAMACGKPIVATDLETNFVDVIERDIGYVAQIGSVSDWNQVIRLLLADESAVENMGKNSLTLAKNYYNYGAFCQFVAHQIVKMASGTPNTVDEGDIE